MQVRMGKPISVRFFVIIRVIRFCGHMRLNLTETMPTMATAM